MFSQRDSSRLLPRRAFRRRCNANELRFRGLLCRWFCLADTVAEPLLVLIPPVLQHGAPRAARAGLHRTVAGMGEGTMEDRLLDRLRSLLVSCGCVERLDVASTGI